MKLPLRKAPPPLKCPACGQELLFFTSGPFNPGPFYMCPNASPAMGAVKMGDFFVIRCDF